MQAFGVSLNRHSIPFLFLACTPIAFLLLREYFTAFWPSIATRAITVFLELGFITLATLSISNLKQWNISRRYTVLLVIWLLCAGLSTVLGEYPWGGIVRWFELLISFIFGLFIYLLIQQSPQYKNLILYSIITTLLFSLICYLALWCVLKDPYSYNWVVDAPFFNNIRHYGYFIATALPLGYWLLESNEKNKHLLSIFYLSFAWGLIFWTGGRGALIGVAVATAIYFIISARNIKWVLLSILIGAVFSQLFIVESALLNLFRMFSFFDINGEYDLNNISSSRIRIYQESIIYWWHTNPLWGNGADAFRYIHPGIKESVYSHPHNIFIQLLFSYGILGLIIPSYLAISLAFKRFSKFDKKNIIIFSCIISAATHALTDGVLYHAFSLYIVVTLLALSIPSTKKEIKPHLRISISLSLLTLTLFCVFSAQVILSKDKEIDADWIKWNAEYPLYFSPKNWMQDKDSITKDHLIELATTRSTAKCWFYSRHSNPDISQLKAYCQ
jgi:O-antigen ligase